MRNHTEINNSLIDLNNSHLIEINASKMKKSFKYFNKARVHSCSYV